MIGEDAALDAIHAAFAEPVLYTGQGLTAAPLLAIFSDVPADGFQGQGATTRTRSFEFRKADLPGRPAKDLITHKASSWRVIDVVDRDDIGRWVVSVERAA